jgi:hypothetical protein
VGVDHRRFHAGVTQEFLHGANIVAGREQVGGKRMAQGMGGRPLADARALDAVAQCPRDRTFMQVPADALVSPRVDAQAGRRKDELPAEVAAGAGRFAVERFGQRHGANAAGQIALVSMGRLVLNVLLSGWCGSDFGETARRGPASPGGASAPAITL